MAYISRILVCITQAIDISFHVCYTLYHSTSKLTLTYDNKEN